MHKKVHKLWNWIQRREQNLLKLVYKHANICVYMNQPYQDLFPNDVHFIVVFLFLHPCILILILFQLHQIFCVSRQFYVFPLHFSTDWQWCYEITSYTCLVQKTPVLVNLVTILVYCVWLWNSLTWPQFLRFELAISSGHSTNLFAWGMCRSKTNKKTVVLRKRMKSMCVCLFFFF